MRGITSGWAVKATVVIVLASLFYICFSATSLTVGDEAGLDLTTSNLHILSSSTSFHTGIILALIVIVFLAIMVGLKVLMALGPRKPHGVQHDRIVRYTLVLQWPATLVIAPARGYLINVIAGLMDFNIHGLWATKPVSITTRTGPKYLDDFYPDEDCSPALVPNTCINRLSPHTMALLRENWKNLRGGTDKKFWLMEARKHSGHTGWLPVVYFWNAVNLKKDLKILEVLAREGIVPGSTGFRPWDYVAALREHLGVNCWVKCYHGADGHQYLEEIGVCVVHKNQLVDCHGRLIRNCRENQELRLPLPIVQ